MAADRNQEKLRTKCNLSQMKAIGGESFACQTSLTMQFVASLARTATEPEVKIEKSTGTPNRRANPAQTKS